MKKSLAMPKRTDKTVPDLALARSIIGGNNIMKLQKLSLFGAVAGALMLTAVFAPKVNALPTVPIVYFDFENGTLTSVAKPGPGGNYPLLQTTTITKVGTSFSGSGGHFTIVDTNLGTTTNQLTGAPGAPGYTSLPHALDTGGQTQNGQVGQVRIFGKDCFQFSVDTTGYSQLSLSFALKSTGAGTYKGIQVFANGTPVTSTGTIDGVAAGTTTLEIGTIGSHAPENFATINQDGSYHVYNFDISAAANTTNAIIEICLSGSSNSSSNDHAYFDNIQVRATVPEPSTYIGGLLGVGVLCWSQRRWFTRFLRLRRA